MESICAVIDTDGFILHQKYAVRELAFVGVNWMAPLGRTYDLTPVLARGVCGKEMYTLHFVTENIHGLSAYPQKGEETDDPSFMNRHIVELYGAVKEDARNIVAYKGGHHEKDILNTLRIPNVNLEVYGCPPFKELPIHVQTASCGLHAVPNYCAKIKAGAYRDWILSSIC